MIDDARPLRLLLVEDDWLIASELTRMVTEAGWQVAGPVSKVAAALDLIRTLSIDGAILDIQLREGERSLAIAAELRDRKIPFFFASAYRTMAQRPDFEDVPVLDKPYFSSGVVTAVHRHILSQPPPDPIRLTAA
jgi:DNA-binding LytR/AlgR family response regulator